MGKWDVQSLISSSPEYYGQEKLDGEDKVPRHVKFAFRNPVRCRIIWVTLRLPRSGSNSVNLDNLNLLSLDDNPFAQVNRRASFGGSVAYEPCLHAKRLLVVGSSVKNDTSLESSQSSNQLNIKSWLERAPQLNRFKVSLIFRLLILFSSFFFWGTSLKFSLNYLIENLRFQLNLKGL